MQYGIPGPTGPWAMNLRIASEPRCPGCAEFLQPVVVEFREGWAWCAVCVEMGLHCEPWITGVLEGVSMQECSAVVNGLRFYTPGVINGEAKTAYEQMEISDIMTHLSTAPPSCEGAYALTPDREHLLADLDLGELQQVQHDLRNSATR